MKNKIDILNNEIKDLSKFNDSPNNNRMKEIVQNFIDEFRKAKEDLISTKEYLDKKSREIKEIKKEKETVEKKLKYLKNQYDELKMKDNKIKESYNGILNTLKRKDEIINKLEMRMIH
ncbi:hypothetical protein NBO_364g0018 [Nosema bombycis CQ1]|uniref:Uncharacterized protein n=1 Tax=Nosema bombycis (strain CQ1 / CVCC 102059) TaxID=578461 RepID=R0KRH5_NOSB1|nr:hypothetical protein NBO_364g0018 [Nosema bombycis CQ1]|eukprot:EOB12812.1 hypothetical protein NBO_364g0018 [Nosema bombycis CQ1]